MTTHRTCAVQVIRRSALVVAAIVMSGTPVSAQHSGEPPYVVPAAAFNLDGSGSTNYFFSFGGGYLQQSGTTVACFQAPVHLPDTFRIGSMTVHGFDTNASSDYTVFLSRKYYFDSVGSSQEMASASMTGSGGFQVPRDDAIRFSTIDNRNYAYQLTTCMPGNAGSSLGLYAVSLAACADPGIVVDSSKITDADVFVACDTLETNGTVAVTAGRNVEFVAGANVALANGFSVQGGVTLTVSLEPALLPPPPP